MTNLWKEPNISVKVRKSFLIFFTNSSRVYYVEISAIAIFSESNIDDKFCQKCGCCHRNGFTKLYLSPDPLCLLKTFWYSKNKYKSSDSPGGHVWIVHPFQKCLKRSNSAF